MKCTKCGEKIASNGGDQEIGDVTINQNALSNIHYDGEGTYTRCLHCDFKNYIATSPLDLVSYN